MEEEQETGAVGTAVVVDQMVAVHSHFEVNVYQNHGQSRKVSPALVQSSLPLAGVGVGVV